MFIGYFASPFETSVTETTTMIRKILPLLFLFFTVISEAQIIKSQSAFRLLQTAQSLLETRQWDAAEELFKQGLAKASSFNDYYCMAYGNQGLGTLYTQLEQKEKAIACYQKSVQLYKAQKLPILANAAESLLKSVQGIGDLYAGIEIGAKGIKLSVVEVKLSKDKEFDYTLKVDTAINTDAASLSYQSEKETQDAIQVLLDLVKARFNIPGKRIFVVISSGLKQELDKYNKTDYFASIIRPDRIDPAIRITSVSAIEEAELSLLGIVPQRNRFTASQLDVGSGNTKGGFFNGDRKFVPVTLSVGTKSFQRLLEGKSTGDIQQFAEMAMRMWTDSLSFVVNRELFNKPEFKSREVLYLSGGIVWAITAFLHPAEWNKNEVEMTTTDIKDFRNRLLVQYDELTQPAALRTIPNAEEALAARNLISRAMKTYDRRAMLAGAIWLDELMKKINDLNPGKKIIFPRYGYVGWISGYIIRKATQQYNGLIGPKGNR